jgi:NarL family two-component system response regulator LiaR
MEGESAASQQIRVLIVDDHQVVRQGLRTFLELHDDIEVVGEAGDGAEAVEMVGRLVPHVVLLDLVMPRLDGIGATRQIVGMDTGARVIALTSFAEDNQVFPAIQAGASSYLLKDVSPDELIDAIRAAYQGEPRLHPEVAKKLMEAMRGVRDSAAAAGVAGGTGAIIGGAPGAPAGAAQGSRQVAGDLTDREREVIGLVAQGKSNQEIAHQFFISEKTVKTHISHILAKLGLKDRTQLAIFAIRNDLAGPQ